MTKKVLIVVDMQNDFVTGPLGTKEAQAIVPAIAERIKSFDGTVIYTRDTHQENYLETQEGKKLPVVHCIEGTKGWELVEPLKTLQEQADAPVFDKPVFGSLALAAALKEEYDKGNLEEAELIGICTDICVVSNALLIKANMPELRVSLDSSCCAGVTAEKHEAALETMRSCQVEVR